MARLPSSMGLVLLAVAQAACGSRSTLFADAAVETGSGGAGGTPSTTSTTSSTMTRSTGDGGSGGTGSVAIECATLEITTPPATLEGGFGSHQRRPTWALSSDDGTRTTLVSSWQAAEGPGGPFPISLVHTSVEPWVDFPSGGILGGNYVASYDAGESLAAGRASDNRFGLLFSDAATADGGLRFSNDFVPLSGEMPPVTVVDATTKEALFAAQGPGGHLLGIAFAGISQNGTFHEIRGAFALEDGSVDGPMGLGCSAGQMYADAVGAGDRWLMAMSNGGPFGANECEGPDPGWPDDVQIVVATLSPFSFDKTDEFGAPGGATEVKMAPAPDGAWVVTGTPPGQVVSGTFIGARIDLDGKILFTFPVTTGDPIEEYILNGTLTVAGVGDHLLVAWVDFGGDKGPYLRIKAFDPSGNVAAQTGIFPGTSYSGAPALLGSPVTNSAVLAWSETPDQGSGDGDKIRAARVDCIGSR